MENSLIQSNAIWDNYKGQDLSVTAIDHIFFIEVAAFFSKIDYYSVLSEKELSKSSRFLHLADRENYIVRKYLLRQLLSKFLHQPPEEITYFKIANKKPAVAELQFNTSHTKGYVVIAISDQPIGIDIEYLNPDFNYPEILTQCFNSEELDFIKKGKDPLLNFYTLWTRKEALIKATGEGLIENIDKIASIGQSFERNNIIFKMDSFKKGNILLSTAYVPKAKTLKLWTYSP